MDNWRLTAEVIVYVIPGTGNIYVAAPEKKQYQIAVSKLITNNAYEEIRVPINEFNLRIEVIDEEILQVYVKNDNLPKSHEWFRVMNFYKPHIGVILCQAKNDCGNFNESIFEFCFSDEYQSEVTLANRDMPLYDNYFEEMRRRLNCEIFKKTKKWVPGHRYDSAKETVYYLGPVNCRKHEEFNSEFIQDPGKMPEGYLYVNSIKPEYKSVSDVMKHSIFGDGKYDLKVARTTGMMVDSGEALDPDFGDDIRNYWEKIWENTEKECLETTKFGYSYYDNPKQFFDILSYQSQGKTDYPDVIREKTFNLVVKLVEQCVEKNWNIEKHRKDLIIGKENTVNTNIQNCIRLFYATFKDINPMKNIYYGNLFKKLGIDLESIVRSTLQNWSEDKIYSNISNFLKYSWYFERSVEKSKVKSTQRINSTNYSIPVITLESLFPKTPVLVSTVIGMIKDARDNYGYGVSEYNLVNVGTKRQPKEYIKCTVTLDDIIEKFGGVSKIPENLRNDILASKFVFTEVSFDKDLNEIK